MSGERFADARLHHIVARFYLAKCVNRDCRVASSGDSSPALPLKKYCSEESTAAKT